jgi:hypothetical protein
MEERPMTPLFWENHGAVDAVLMSRLIAELNIEHFHKLLVEERSEAARKGLRRLLAKQEAKLAAIVALSEDIIARH